MDKKEQVRSLFSLICRKRHQLKNGLCTPQDAEGTMKWCLRQAKYVNAHKELVEKIVEKIKEI